MPQMTRTDVLKNRNVWHTIATLPPRRIMRCELSPCRVMQISAPKKPEMRFTTILSVSVLMRSLHYENRSFIHHRRVHRNNCPTPDLRPIKKACGISPSQTSSRSNTTFKTFNWRLYETHT